MQNDKFLNQIFKTLNSTAIVAMTDAKGRIIYANQMFCDISGYTVPELLGKDHRIINSGYHSKEFFKDMWTTILSGKSWSGEIQNKKKNGEFYWVQTTISPIFDDIGDLVNFLTVRFDITEMKQTQMLLMESNRLVALGEMASGIAHEINNPLTIIIGRLSLLKRKISRHEPPETIDAELDLLEKTVYRISSIVNGLRKLSRMTESDPMEVFSIKSIIEEAQELFVQKLKSKEISFELYLEQNYNVKGRAVQLSQVIVNLINNSVDAIESSTEKWIHLKVEEKNDCCLVQIIDSGKGIPKDILNKIMTPFFTTKQPGKGTGLGLSLSKKMIEESFGKFYYDSTKPNTTFCIELPLEKS